MTGQATDIGPNGGALLVGMGPTWPTPRSNSNENHRELAVVTKRDDTERTNLSSLEPGERRALSGPFEWTALKSKYFVTGVLAGRHDGWRDQRGHRLRRLPRPGEIPPRRGSG